MYLNTVSVGFIGYPNVGKSSIINTLRSKKVCNVAPIPGETKVGSMMICLFRCRKFQCCVTLYSGKLSQAYIFASTMLGKTITILRTCTFCKHIVLVITFGVKCWFVAVFHKAHTMHLLIICT